MPEGYAQINEGSGKKLHTFQRTIGANTVEDEVMLLGEQYLAHYRVVPTSAVSLATGSSHLLQIMAGASLAVYVRRIRIYQVVAATTAAINNISLFRLSSAGTGGTSVTPAPADTTDSAAGATAMTLPTAKGTETTLVGFQSFLLYQTAPTAGGGLNAVLLCDWDFERLRTKAERIPAGTANGLAIKLSSTAAAGASVLIEADISEANF